LATTVGPTRQLPIEDRRKLRAALERLDERERRVLQLRHGLGGERRHSLQEIGRLLGVSRERVRQLETRGLRKLDSAVDSAGRRDAPPVARASFVRAFLRPWTLLLLRLRPAHGYDLSERLRELGVELGPELYRFLRRLEQEGLVRSTWTASGGAGPGRRVYRLTTKGTKQLHRDAKALGEVADTLGRFWGDYDKLVAELDREKERRHRRSARADGDGRGAGA
jgi:PadR family transcriptional regulator, regulatory protein PadR